MFKFLYRYLLFLFLLRYKRSKMTCFGGFWCGTVHEVACPSKARLKRGEFRNLLLGVSLEAYAPVGWRFMEGDAAIRCAA